MEHLYLLTGAVFAACALLSLVDRSNRKRFGNALFWGLMATSLLAGSHLGDFANGLLVLGLVGLAGFGFIGQGPAEDDQRRRAQGLRRAARQQAVPAGPDHSLRRARRDPAL